MSRDQVAGLLRLASQQAAAGQLADAAAQARRVLEAFPDEVGALHLAGALAQLAGRSNEALALMTRAAALSPSDARVQYNLGVIHAALNQREPARSAYQAALRISPDSPGALHNLGNLAFEDDDWEGAATCYERALRARPDDLRLVLALAQVAMMRRDLTLATRYFERALALAPDDAQVRWEAAHQQLLCADFERGWVGYEARFGAPHSAAHVFPFSYPSWCGQALAGRHLLVQGEQGFGDEIMFFSLVPQLLEQGARVTLVGQPQLASLWRESFAGVVCHPLARDASGAFRLSEPDFAAALDADRPDYQIACGSLPRWLRRTPADFERQAPFITPRASDVGQWREWLEQRVGPAAVRRIGLAWSGRRGAPGLIAQRKDERRSLAVHALAALSRCTDVAWVSLQPDPVPGYPVQSAPTLIETGARLTDFAATAALISQLDLVISVDTAVAHLAAAMGKPVWILLPFAGEWRWGLDPERCLWWPGARLFRQARPGDWGEVLARVASALCEPGGEL